VASKPHALGESEVLFNPDWCHAMDIGHAWK